MSQLLLYLNSIHPMSEELQHHLSSILEHRVVHKKEFLLQEGKQCDHIYFIEKGLFRCYYTNDSAKEICSWFMRTGDVIISVESFFKRIPSWENIQALEDGTVYFINYKQLAEAYKKYPEFNFIGRVLTEHYYCQSEQRLYWLRMNTAADRYQLLLKNYPWIIQQVSSTNIASFLGISLETLSRLRK